MSDIYTSNAQDDAVTMLLFILVLPWFIPIFLFSLLVVYVTGAVIVAVERLYHLLDELVA